MARNETVERDLYTKTELLKTVEDQHKLYIKKLRDEYNKLQSRLDYEIFCKDIEFEDLRSYTRRLFENNDELSVNIETLQD